MANQNSEDKDGSPLNGSTKRDNDVTEKARRPDQPQPSDSAVNNESPELEVVDQDPGERQKENQNQSKDDPLAA